MIRILIDAGAMFQPCRLILLHYNIYTPNCQLFRRLIVERNFDKFINCKFTLIWSFGTGQLIIARYYGNYFKSVLPISNRRFAFCKQPKDQTRLQWRMAVQLYSVNIYANVNPSSPDFTRPRQRAITSTRCRSRTWSPDNEDLACYCLYIYDPTPDDEC